MYLRSKILKTKDYEEKVFILDNGRDEMVTVKIYEKAAEVPEMTCEDFFHSTELMAVLEATPRQRPLMVVAFDDAAPDGSTAEKHVVGHMLVTVRTRRSWLPPYIYMHARVLG